MAEIKQEPMSKKKLDYVRRERTREMRQQIISFSLMIFLTFVAFGLVAMDVSPQFVIPIVIGMAFIQVILQFYYFMHMKDKGHEFAKLFIMTGIFFALSFVVTFIYIVWIGKPI
ncbi:cytochrome C oxidase subunit IV family protein [Salinicoccus sp. ID82-1]|uniref:Cytochrome B6 n=1 Tax=Salinicoccus cyprini TaxID=2493691 RepID=A0A558AXV9_9STAP|nr:MULTISPECIES: cytochrome C oxidase subunit IV family protein [Salinicoccus]MCG1008619.1 cytochrome C oxidase subunit IV family protein [Salinicoccus sp. ID82-1]TVT29097.1 cytochrome B6 [Salinicoccus cyprini]